MLHCDLRVRWKVASDLRFRAAISEPKTPSFCGISGDLAPSTRKSLAIAIVRFWCAKLEWFEQFRFSARTYVFQVEPQSHNSRETSICVNHLKVIDVSWFLTFLHQAESGIFRAFQARPGKIRHQQAAWTVCSFRQQWSHNSRAKRTHESTWSWFLMPWMVYFADRTTPEAKSIT